MYFLRSLRLTLPIAILAFALTPFASAQMVINVSPGDSLQNALNSVPEGGIVQLSAGTYSAPAGGFTVFPRFPDGSTAGFTVRAAAGATVILDGNNSGEIFTLTTPKPVTFQNLIFRNGRSTTDGRGGAMSTDSAKATFISCTFENNVGRAPTTGGGAIWLNESTVSFQSCTWTNNNSLTYGGALVSSRSRVFISSSRFIGNRCNPPGHASFSSGGAIHADGSVLRIDHTRFENNQAGYVGGAIYAYGAWQQPFSNPTTDLLVSDSFFTGNTAVKDPGATIPGPTTGGAISLEDQVRGRIVNSRFTLNTANQGGALSSYRTATEIDGCVFRLNQAVGTGNGEAFGGHIFIQSDDNADVSTGNGAFNRPSASLIVQDTLIAGGTAASARQGGGIFAAGDLHAGYGVGVPQNGTPESNRAAITLTRVAFSDLISADPSLGTGGAMTAAFVNLSMVDCIVQSCSATHNGGGVQLIQNSVAAITRTTFANNSAGVLGGAFNMFGGNLTLSNSQIVDNRITGNGGGAAIMAGAAPAGGGLPALDLVGTVQNCVLSNNTGQVPVYDGNGFPNGPYNRLQYRSNQIFSPDPNVFFIDALGFRTVSQFNSLVVSHADGSATTKSPTANVVLASAAVTGAILMLPPLVAQSGAPDEAAPIPSFVAYAGSGGSVSVNGTPSATSVGLRQTATDGTQTLSVGGTQFATVPPSGVALNISTRISIGTQDNVAIAGFIITGPAPKRVLVVARGPSLPVAGALADPNLTLFDSAGASLGGNNDWRVSRISGAITSDQVIDITASGVSPTNPAEAAMIVTLQPGAYTAVVDGVNSGTGVGLVEVYDLDPQRISQLANISTRGLVRTGDNVMIGGFIIGGGVGQTRVIVRGLGPSLGQFGIANPLADPSLAIFNAQGVQIATNDNWQTSPDAAAISAINLQPQASAEAALLLANPARAAYTAILRGVNDTSGVGIVEVFVTR